MKQMTDPLLAIEAALTQAQRDAILAKFPHMHGAKVADLLAEGVDSDAELDRTEPWWEAHGKDADWPEGTQAALLALAWSGRTGYPAELNPGRVRACCSARLGS